MDRGAEPECRVRTRARPSCAAALRSWGPWLLLCWAAATAAVAAGEAPIPPPAPDAVRKFRALAAPPLPPPDPSRDRLIPERLLGTPPNGAAMALPPPPEIPPPPEAATDLKQEPRAIRLEVETADPAPRDLEVGPTACTTCGRGLLAGDPYFMGNDGRPSCSTCGGPGCVPGRKGCTHLEAHTTVGRLFGALYECLCCPDPCYQPMWIPEANAAYFVDYARPQTITRIRNDNGIDLVLPDRAEFFWARADGKGAGPPPPTVTFHPRPHPAPGSLHPVVPGPPGRPPGLTGPISFGAPSGRPSGLGPAATPHAHRASHAAATSRAANLRAVTTLDFHDLYFYQEAAADRASVFVEIPYRFIEPAFTPTHSGFSDMNIGTKSLLLDCELLQLTFQFRTYIPIGNPRMGLGTGHVSLEPSLLSSLRLTPSAYLQGQISEWVPLGGNPTYSGALLHYHFSLNQVLYRVTPDSPLIGTMELNAWSFQNGAYTDPYLGFRKASGDTYASAGPGLRMVICNYIDIGLGTAFAISNPHWSSSLYRLEFRVRY